MITRKTINELRQLVKEAARIHEESFVPGVKGKARSNFYGITISDAAIEVCSTCPELVIPIYLLLQPACWNEILDWANSEEEEDH